MPLDLTGRKWPKINKKRSKKSWANWDSGPWRRYTQGIFVHEGQMYAKELSFYGMTRPIPPEECAITSLFNGGEHGIYGATSGKKAHVFRYNPKGQDGAVLDIGTIGKEEAIRNSLVVTNDGVVIGGTSAGSGKKKYDGGKIFQYKSWAAPGEFIQEWEIGDKTIDIVGIPIKGEGIGGMVLDKARGIAYGISDKTGILFSYDTKTKKIRKIGPISAGNPGFSLVLTIDSKGKVFGAAGGGRIFCFDPETKKIARLEAFVPTFAGRNLYDQLTAITLDGRSGLLYGGTREGNLFAFDPQTCVVRSLGRPTNLGRIRCLAITNDGRVFGASGEDEDMNHMFCYNPKGPELKDLGIPIATMEKRWYGYRFDCMTTGSDGEIYLGESDRISHLFIYHPRIMG
jgi:hypothetical protein